MNVEQIHQKAIEIAKRFLLCEQQLQQILREVDKHKVYYHFGYSSLFYYAVEALGLSRDVAFNHIAVARKSAEIPELKVAIDAGEVTVSQARHFASAINTENQAELIHLAKTCTRDQLKREIARMTPEAEQYFEKVRYISGERAAVEVKISAELLDKLRRVQDLIGKQKFANLAETLEELVEFYLEKQDPVRKADRVQNREQAQHRKQPHTDLVKASNITKPHTNLAEVSNAKKQALTDAPNAVARNTCTVQKSPIKRVPVPSSIRHAITLRDQDQCTATLSGSRCSEKRWLHFHHIKAVEQGGQNSAENLRLLCSGHHRALHFKSQ